MTTKAVATKKPTEISTNVSMSSNIEVDQDIITPPRIQLSQALSEVVKDEKVKIGHFYNSATSEDMGTDVSFIPLLIKQGAIYMTTEDGMVCRSANGILNSEGASCKGCPHGMYWKDWSKGTPGCSAQINCVVVLPDEGYMPALLSFTKANFKTGTKLVSMINWNTKIKDPHEAMFSIKSEKMNSGKGDFYAMKLGAIELVDKGLLSKLAQITESFAGTHDIVQVEEPVKPEPEKVEMTVEVEEDSLPF